MKPTKLKSLLKEVDWHNRHGTSETFRKAVYNLGSWVLYLWGIGRINPDEFTVSQRKPKEEV